MSKKPVPGLMGNAKLLSGFSSQEVNVGARKITRLVRPGESDLLQGVLDADSLFETAFGDVGVFVLEQMLQEAGFPEYPAIITVSEREAIAERFTGAAPNIENPEDIPASLAWVLVRFAEAEYLHQSYISEHNLGGIFFAGVRMGRLAEWWVWRKNGHDLGAVQQAGFSSGRGKKKGPRAVSEKSALRRREIVKIVDKLGEAPRFGTGEVNRSEWARMVLREARIASALMHNKGHHSEARILNEIAGQTERTVTDAIKLAIQNGEIGKFK